MKSDLTCRVFSDRLADFLEREVDEWTRAEMESHALACAECGPLLADLRKLRVDAASLSELSPSRDLWLGIAALIDAPVIPIGKQERGKQDRGKREAGSGRRDSQQWMAIAAAAVVLVVLTATTTRYLTIRSSGDTASTAAANPTSVVTLQPPAPQPVDSAPTSAPLPTSRFPLPASRSPLPAARLVSSKPSAEQVYGTEITRLRAIVERRRSQLDPVTVSVIERNLKVIDDAIAQCRAALAKDPASRFLVESLNNALENKVELLRTAAMLPSRT